MREPTKADLTAAVARLTEENAGLRDLLGAVGEYARSVPQAVYGQQREELCRAKDVLISLYVITDPDGAWAWGWGNGAAAEYLRKGAAEPAGYEAYVSPEDAGPSALAPAAVLAESITSGKPLLVDDEPEPYAGHLRTPAIPAGPGDPNRLRLDGDCWLPLADGACGHGLDKNGEGIACGVPAGHLRRHERGARPEMGGGTAHWPNLADPETGDEPQPEPPAGTPALMTDDDDPACECGHQQTLHDDGDDSDAGRARHECLAVACRCTAFRLPAASVTA